MAAKQRELSIQQRGAGTVIPVSLFDQVAVFGLHVFGPDLHGVIDVRIAVKDCEAFGNPGTV